MGRFQIDGLPAGRYSLGLMHAVLDSFDLVLPLVTVAVTNGATTDVMLATPSAGTAYARSCSQRLQQIGNKSDLVQAMRIASSCQRLARRAEAQIAVGRRAPDSAREHAQPMSPVSVVDTMRPLSLLAVEGFEVRRQHGLGFFVTDTDIARHLFQSLAEVLMTMPGVHVENGSSVFLHGTREGYCAPNVFVDDTPMMINFGGNASLNGQGNGRGGGGAALRGGGGGGGGGAGMTWGDLSLIIRPEMIKGIELYDTSGTIPAQFDYTSSTGCGSIVIWTR
jgi:hypothetical protein